LRTFAVAILLLAASPGAALARGGDHRLVLADAGPPCGVGAGGLPDPAQTRRCLAAQFKPPKSKPANGPRAQAPTNATTPPETARGG
jgi:hypothetical protein